VYADEEDLMRLPTLTIGMRGICRSARSSRIALKANTYVMRRAFGHCCSSQTSAHIVICRTAESCVVESSLSCLLLQEHGGRCQHLQAAHQHTASTAEDAIHAGRTSHQWHMLCGVIGMLWQTLHVCTATCSAWNDL
jgi:hypothetical protein